MAWRDQIATWYVAPACTETAGDASVKDVSVFSPCRRTSIDVPPPGVARRPAANGHRRVIVRNRPVFDRRQAEDRLERLARLVLKGGSDSLELRGDRRAVQERFHRMAIDTHAVGAIGQREH